jgi:hypothetical protein
MAFLRRKGNAYYLVHNVRREGKVKQLHLARLGDRPRITDDVVRQVSRAYPFVDVNWTALREWRSRRRESRSQGEVVRAAGCAAAIGTGTADAEHS